MPAKDEFIRYVGPAEIHDSTFIAFRKIEPDTYAVELKTHDGATLSLRFLGVSDVNHSKPEGIIIYSLNEVTWPGDMKRFVFANSDEESSSCFEIACKEMTTDLTMSSSQRAKARG